MRKHLLLIVAFLLLIACGSNNKPQQTIPQDVKKVSIQNKLIHYWDSFPYADKVVFTDTLQMQSLLTEWIQTLSRLSENEASTYARLSITAGQGKQAGQRVVFQWLETLLNDPNSPYRNEELFIPVLEAMTQDSLLSELNKEHPRFLLTQALKNRKGTQATDITFITKDGKLERLYDVHCEQILVYFFNPDCHDCKRVGDILKNDAHLNDMQMQGRLQIVAIYPDEDLTGWKKVDESYPANWIIGRAPTKQEQGKYKLPGVKDKYNLPAIPSVYILDSNHKVLVKDAILQ